MNRTVTSLCNLITVLYVLQREQGSNWGCNRGLHALLQYMRQCRPGPRQVRHEPLPGGQGRGPGAALAQTVSNDPAQSIGEKNSATVGKDGNCRKHTKGVFTV